MGFGECSGQALAGDECVRRVVPVRSISIARLHVGMSRWVRFWERMSLVGFSIPSRVDLACLSNLGVGSVISLQNSCSPTVEFAPF